MIKTSARLLKCFKLVSCHQRCTVFTAKVLKSDWPRLLIYKYQVWGSAVYRVNTDIVRVSFKCFYYLGGPRWETNKKQESQKDSPLFKFFLYQVTLYERKARKKNMETILRRRIDLERNIKFSCTNSSSLKIPILYPVCISIQKFLYVM